MNPCPLLFVWWVLILFCLYCITFLSSPLIFHECSLGHTSPFSAWRVSIEINGLSSCGWKEEYILISAPSQKNIIHWKKVLVSLLKAQGLVRQILVGDPNRRSGTEAITTCPTWKQKPEQKTFYMLEQNPMESQWIHYVKKCTVPNLILGQIHLVEYSAVKISIHDL